MSEIASIFQFLSTPTGQTVVAQGGADIVAVITDLMKLFHKSATSTSSVTVGVVSTGPKA